jgi:hypothetical protein
MGSEIIIISVDKNIPKKNNVTFLVGLVQIYTLYIQQVYYHCIISLTRSICYTGIFIAQLMCETIHTVYEA